MGALRKVNRLFDFSNTFMWKMTAEGPMPAGQPPAGTKASIDDDSARHRRQKPAMLACLTADPAPAPRRH